MYTNQEAASGEELTEESTDEEDDSESVTVDEVESVPSEPNAEPVLLSEPEANVRPVRDR